MLSLASIMLPMQDNAGKSTHDAYRLITDSILRTFGGYTASPIMEGCWRDESTGKVYRDAVKRIDIVADWTKHSGALVSLARSAADLMSQECVLVILPTGAQFVQPAFAIAA